MNIISILLVFAKNNTKHLKLPIREGKEQGQGNRNENTTFLNINNQF